MATISVRTAPDWAGLQDLLGAISDPVERRLLTGRASTVREAEEMYLDSAYPQVLALLESPLTNEELGRHPLFVLYRIEALVGPPTRPQPPEPRAGPLALPHFHQQSRDPKGHLFYETEHRKARKRR